MRRRSLLESSFGWAISAGIHLLLLMGTALVWIQVYAGTSDRNTGLVCRFGSPPPPFDRLEPIGDSCRWTRTGSEASPVLEESRAGLELLLPSASGEDCCCPADGCLPSIHAAIREMRMRQIHGNDLKRLKRRAVVPVGLKYLIYLDGGKGGILVPGMELYIRYSYGFSGPLIR